jgi:uncharacterized Fe-S cluster protein YjdI
VRGSDFVISLTVMKSTLVAGFLVLSAATAQAQTNPLLGDWRIVSAGLAPWIGPDKINTIKEDNVRRFVKQTVSFTAGDVKSRDPLLACKGPRYEPATIPPAGLFQGHLPEPKADIAKALGFPAADVASVNITCPNGAFSYYFRDKNTALFALDNVIYTLKRR